MVARRAHNPEVGGSSPPPATRDKSKADRHMCLAAFFVSGHDHRDCVTFVPFPDGGRPEGLLLCVSRSIAEVWSGGFATNRVTDVFAGP